MATIDYIVRIANGLSDKYHSRDPFYVCKELGIRLRYKDLGHEIKAFYFYQSRIRNIVLNTNVSEITSRILVAHELGHDRLHKNLAMLKGLQEIKLFDKAQPIEYEANLFAAEFLIEDNELLKLLNDKDKTFFDIAKELCIPADLLDFKFRVMKHKGYRVQAPYTAVGNFLKNSIDGCYN